MATHEWTAQKPLVSSLLARHVRLQQAARKGSKKYLRWGDNGPHIEALQRGLNTLRKNWRLLEPDGKFGSKTYDVLKAYQDDANRFNREDAHYMAGEEAGNAPGSRAYKKIYHFQRTRIKRDGIAGPKTLGEMDTDLHWKETQTLQ